jgi:SET domain-containing protein
MPKESKKFSHLIKNTEVRKSQIQCAGRGTFATKNFKKGDKVTFYRGIVYDDIENMELYDITYAANYGSDRWIDGSPEHGYGPNNNPGPFINDSRGSKFKTNVRFGVPFDIDPEGKEAVFFVYASRSIKAGEELFASYGQSYWDNMKM